MHLFTLHLMSIHWQTTGWVQLTNPWFSKLGFHSVKVKYGIITTQNLKVSGDAIMSTYTLTSDKPKQGSEFIN